MFKEKVYEADGFLSDWKIKQTICSQSSQTSEFENHNQGTSTTSAINVETQTETNECNKTATFDSIKLASWLKYISPVMINELNDNSLSSAMESLKFESEPEDVYVKKIQFFNVIETSDEIYTSALSWNSSGNTLAVSYSYTHQSWCRHQVNVNLYTFKRDDKLPSDPTKSLLCESCVTTLSFHPEKPFILCAGTISGEVYLWNLQVDLDNLIGMVVAHDDRVSNLNWIQNIDIRKVILATSGVDSFLLLWDVNVDDNIFNITHRYTTVKLNKRIASPKLYSHKSEGGIVLFDFSPFISNLFILGLEGGTLIKCSLLRAKPLTHEDPTILDPTINCYERHDGEIIALNFCTHREDLFLSCGTDKEIRILHIDQITPVQIIFMVSALSTLSWVMHEEKLMVGSDQNGRIRLYSLLNGQAITNTVASTGVPFTVHTVNKNRVDVIALGNTKGQVYLYSIPWESIATKDFYDVNQTK